MGDRLDQIQVVEDVLLNCRDFRGIATGAFHWELGVRIPNSYRILYHKTICDTT